MHTKTSWKISTCKDGGKTLKWISEAIGCEDWFRIASSAMTLNCSSATT